MTTIDSLLSEPVGSLLIEGGPGTGKTTFAIELLRKAGHGIYISTRVSKEKLLEQIPGVKELIVRDEDGGGQSAPIKMEDSRLATAVRVVQYLVQLEKRAETRLIVLDSWDAIASEIPSVERLKTEKSLLVIAEARNSKLAFISEESQQTSLNYLVDAVVELKRELHDGAVVRTLELKKLRGSPILNPNALFTLFGARFREFEPVPPHPVRFVKMEDFQPIKHDANFFSTGLRDLDERYSGGFRRGSVNLLEFGENLNPSVHNGSYNIIASNFIMNGGCALVVPGGGQDLRDLVVLANASMPAEAVLNGLAVGAFERYPDPCFFDLSPTSIEDCFDVLWGRMESLKGEANRALVAQMGVDLLESIFDNSKLLYYLSRTFQLIRRKGDVINITAGSSSTLRRKIADLCDIHVKYETINESQVIHSLNPPGPLLQVSYDYSRGYPLPVSTPIL